MPESIGQAAWYLVTIVLAVAGWLFVQVFNDLKERVRVLETKVENIENDIQQTLKTILQKVS